MSQSSYSAAEPVATDLPAKKPFDFDALPFAGLIVWVACILLAVVCNSGSILGREWIWTDDALIPSNPLIGMLNGLQQVWSGIFSSDAPAHSPFGSLALTPEKYLLPQFSPLSQTMFYFERAMFGINPLGYRLVSMALHGSCGAVLYLLLRGLRVRGAVIATLLFVVHPVLVDSVSFLTERRNPLGGLLGLSALYILFRAADVIAAPTGKIKLLPDEKSRLYLIGAVLFLVGLFAQPAIAPLGLVALLVIWARRERTPPIFAAIAIAMTILGGALLVVSSRVDVAHSGYTAKQWERAPTAASEIAVRTQIAGRAIVAYTQKTLLPFPLSMDYGRWVTPNDLDEFRELAPDSSKQRFLQMSPDVGPSVIAAWMFPIVVIGVLITLYALSSRIGRAPFALAMSFVLLLLPFLGFIDVSWMQYSFVSHRAMYLAAIPVMVGLTIAIAPLLADPNQRVSLIASLVIITIIMIRLGAGVSFRYQYNLSFWRESANATISKSSSLNAIMQSPWYSRFQAANSLLQLRETGLTTKDLNDAFDAYTDVLEKRRPGNPEALVQLGRVLFALKQDRDAMERFNFVIANYPEYGLAYRSAGDVMRRLADASPTNPTLRLATLDYYEKAAKADPLDAHSQILIAETAWDIARRLPESDVEGVKARMTQAAEAFDAADEIRPYDVRQLMREAKTLTEMQLFPAAVSRLQAARNIEPQNAELLLLIGDTLTAGQQLIGAESAYRQALGIDPLLVDAYVSFSGILASQQRFDEAQQLLDTGLKKLPDNDKLLETVKKLKEVREKAATQPATRPT